MNNLTEQIDEITGFISLENGIIYYHFDGNEYTYRGTKTEFTNHVLHFIQTRSQPQQSKLRQLKQSI